MSINQDDSALLTKPVPPSTTLAWRHHHVLDIDDFTREEIELVFQTTDAMQEVLSRPIKKVPTLRGKTVVTLFYEASTRTRVSFELAAKNLSADTVSVTSQTSSATKGESLVDSLDTLQALGANIVVIRHPCSGAPYLVARRLQASIINAGDGWHAHPTQALLDLYTIRKHKGSLKGLKAVIIGDITHSRVAHSNIWGLTTMGIEVTLSGPPTLIPPGLDREHDSFPKVNVDYNLDRAVEGADILMALRLQHERQQSGLLPSIREYVQLYQVNEARLARAKPDALVMHPGPVNEGVEISPAVAHGSQSVIEEQVTNGVAVRMALLYLLAGGKEQ
ncbi:MAG: aspartate carbamoyltransferase catalytic subunit [Chloroflexi bacterium]|nr:aspartate carbamoyltransferase catalytic subunit [Chloroflexota bacterium]